MLIANSGRLHNKMRDFREIKVWEKAHQLPLSVYKFTSNFPQAELYGLTSQIRRASSSIPANIAEACGRGSKADFSRFLHIALGSASELEYHLLLARDLNLLSAVDHEILNCEVIEIKKMLTAFIQHLKADG